MLLQSKLDFLVNYNKQFLLRKQKIALVAFMSADMSLVAEFCGEYPFTVLAMVFDPFVFLHVYGVIRTMIEASSALVTVVAVLPGVYLHVLIQVPSGGVFLFTESTVESVSLVFVLNRSAPSHRPMQGYNSRLINLCASTLASSSFLFTSLF